MRKTIIITGAGSGIGAATTKAFLGDGYHVGLIGRRAETLEATANAHKNALILPCDVADPAAVDSAFAKVRPCPQFCQHDHLAMNHLKTNGIGKQTCLFQHQISWAA